MKLERFFEKFVVLAEMPGAVGKLRELVLQLAVRGSLSKTIDDWVETTVGNVSRLRRGYDLPTQDRNSGSVPIYAANGPIGFHSVRMVKGPGVVTGRSGSIGKVHFVQEDFWPLNTALYVEDFFDNDPEFICLLLKSLHLERFSTATAVPTLNRNVVHSEIVRCPPVAEQKNIVAKVDELMALCDHLEAQQQERETRHSALARASLTQFADAPTPANLRYLFHSSNSTPPDELRKAILTLAIQGKLVPQDPNEGTGEAVLNKIRKRPKEGDENGSSCLDSNDQSLAFALPDTWALARLGQIYESSFYGPRFGKEEYVKEGGIPTIRTTDMTSNGQIVLREPPRVRIDDPRKLALYEVRANDLLVTRSGTIGMMAVFKGDYTAIPSAYLIRFRFPPEVLADFYYLYLSSPHGNDLLGLSLRSIGVPNVNATSISRFTAPLPPLAEQRRIVAKVAQLMASVDALETQLVTSCASAQRLLACLTSEIAPTS
jgi:type I restriction enzyme S subunit